MTSRHPATLATLAVIIVSLTGLAACGASNGSAAPTPSSPSVTVPSSTPSGTPPPASPGTTTSAAVPTDKPVPAENNPPGDIPDNLAFVAYTNKPGHYSFTHPEGWVRTGSGTGVRFTDKLNGVLAASTNASAPPTVSSARAVDVPRLKASVPAFELRSITAVTLPAGSGVRIVFRRNSDPDSVTGKVYRDEVEEYAVFSAGRLIRLDLYGPVGADNVDAYRTMSQSLAIR